MKRKRGNKKGKPKKPSVVAVKEAIPHVDILSTEDNPVMDDFDKDDVDSDMEAETPSSTGTDQPEKIATIISAGPVNKPGSLVYARVKVKIKTSKAFDSQHTSSDAPTQSDTDKSSHQVGLEKLGIVSEKMEDSVNSLPESNLGLLANKSKKAGSIKIKSSRGFSSSSLSPCNNAGLVQGERTNQKESALCQDSQYNKQELDAALEVIKKVMKMDAAEPFNAPVNPIALGIPDYFDVIDTPMDFGTICSNLENGVKYMNSEDVHKDVQYIWENCYKYNNKGDYIVELMKRVKKNFSKYWTTVGLYNEAPQDTESIQVKDVAPSIHGKIPGKSGHLKHKTQKRHGVKKHKDDCLCAICVMMRRRQEREEIAQIVENQIESSDPEGASAVESPCGEDTSSSVDNSQNQDADAEMEDRGEEVKMERVVQYSPFQEKQQEKRENNDLSFQTNGEGDTGERSGEKNSRQFETQMESGSDIQNDTQKEEISMQREDENGAVEHLKPKQSLDESQKAQICENLRRFENPMVLELCGTLFPDGHKSIWSGPHSLARLKGSTRVSSSIHAAISTFMK